MIRISMLVTALSVAALQGVFAAVDWLHSAPAVTSVFGY